MELIRNDFSKELSKLLKKYNKKFEADKGGIYIVDDLNGTDILLSKPTVASEDVRDRLMFIN